MKMPIPYSKIRLEVNAAGGINLYAITEGEEDDEEDRNSTGNTPPSKFDRQLKPSASTLPHPLPSLPSSTPSASSASSSSTSPSNARNVPTISGVGKPLVGAQKRKNSLNAKLLAAQNPQKVMVLKPVGNGTGASSSPAQIVVPAGSSIQILQSSVDANLLKNHREIVPAIAPAS